MTMIQRLKHDLKAGWAAVRYGTAQAATRALEETELLRLRLEVRKLDEKIRDLCRDLGERALALHERGEPLERIAADLEVLRMLREVHGMKAQREQKESDMDDVRSGE
jgi:hypothetical protein